MPELHYQWSVLVHRDLSKYVSLNTRLVPAVRDTSRNVIWWKWLKITLFIIVIQENLYTQITFLFLHFCCWKQLLINYVMPVIASKVRLAAPRLVFVYSGIAKQSFIKNLIKDLSIKIVLQKLCNRNVKHL